MSELVIWITGLPGSGKSAIADALKKSRPEFVILRMDELRKIITPVPTYSDPERELVYRSIVATARVISELGHDAIIDATGNLRRWRDLARQIIPRYVEVYLKCPLEICMEREAGRQVSRSAPREIYRKGKEGWPVPGMGAPYEEPLNAELTIETDHVSVEEAVSLILKFVEK